MIITVNNFDEAKAYPVMYNNSELLMDNNQDVFYVKSVDGLGKVTIKTYRFEQIENEKPMTPEDFVTKAQFNELSSKLDTIIRELGGVANGQQHNGHDTAGTGSSRANAATIPTI